MSFVPSEAALRNEAVSLLARLTLQCVDGIVTQAVYRPSEMVVFASAMRARSRQFGSYRPVAQ
jgi:hypothetical protein